MRAQKLALSAVLAFLPLACAAVGDRQTIGGAGGVGTTSSSGEGGVGLFTGSTTMTASAGGGMAQAEPCDNIDNNGNGLIDEGCGCTPGASQPCWSGPPMRRGIGICRDGVQVCEKFGEFSSWGPCQGEVLPAAEIAGNGIDEDCDGGDPGGGCDAKPEDCGNNVDDDCDGLVDCADPDCKTSCSSCAPSETSCNNGVDDDCDGFIDCVDPDCAATTECAPPPPPPGCVPEFPWFVEIWCGDGKDNDCDGKIDCDDPDCKRPGQCGCAPKETNCSDGVDEDCDGSTDCADLDCQLCTPGATRWCDDPMYCHWGQQTCAPDGHWGTCYEVMDSPGSCGGSLYNAQCCVQAGECCQNYPTDQTSIGDCTGISTCQ